MTTPPASIDFGILLGLAYQAFVDELRGHLQNHGFEDINSAYGYVFRALSADALHLRQVAERLGMTDQGAAKIINEMEQRGYVERYPDLVDGRVKKLRLSARGLSALGLAREFHDAFERRFDASLGGTKIKVTRRTLEAMVATTGTDAAHARLRAM